MDTAKLGELAVSSAARANRCHIRFQNTGDRDHLNDAFYWWGHANAYKGIIAMIELQTVIEDELEAEGSCP